MINKIVQSMAEAMAGIRDSAVVLIGGFGSIGQPNALIPCPGLEMPPRPGQHGGGVELDPVLQSSLKRRQCFA